MLQPFLYDLEWGAGVTLSRLVAGGGAKVRLRPSAGDNLIRLSPLIRPLVELHWVRMVAGLNGLALMEDDLRRYLFGAERVAGASRWRTDRARSVSLARSLYGHLPAGSFVWNSPRNVTEANSLELLDVLEGL